MEVGEGSRERKGERKKIRIQGIQRMARESLRVEETDGANARTGVKKLENQSRLPLRQP